MVWICTGYCNTLRKGLHEYRRKWHKLCFSLSRLIRVNKSNRLGWEWHVTYIQEARSPHKILSENAKVSTLLPSSRHLQGASVNRPSLQHFFPGSATLGRMPLSPFYCHLESVLVEMEPWIGAQRAFAVKAFYKSCDNFCDRSAWFSKRVRDSSQ